MGDYGILILPCNIFNLINMIQNILFQMLKIKMENKNILAFSMQITYNRLFYY